MRFGFVGSFGTVAQQLEMAREAEEHGWDGFFTWDGISIAPADTWDPWVLLGAAAGVTERIRLGALVFALARRRPWKVAREALTVDHLSGGRLVLPVGLGVLDDAGFSRVSGEALGARERAERLDDALAILELAWTGEPFSYAGRHHTVEDVLIAPRPVQTPRIPVWPVAGVGSERSMGRAARWDGAVLQRIGGDEPLEAREVEDAVAWLRERRTAAGLDGVEGFEVVLEGVLPEDPAAARDHVAARASAGVTWWIEARWDPARATPEALLARIRQGPPDA
ncbi:LLM class flavin-dependent oxidoreductase [Actinotalea subterranea]|uniref:LLM class flavin-dependent oxidoreductase n=1 Tax=Actinotalea subterranea TaxID=2607497 RepID=UPI0011EF9CBC|nr:LLM class flavin-dependent oxidoreductase [Actinotalea subterranea]